MAGLYGVGRAFGLGVPLAWGYNGVPSRECAGSMNRQKISLISATVSVVLALEALLVVLLGMTTGWAGGLADEGPPAHIVQILSIAQLPFVLAFWATADWKHLWTRRIVTPICLALVFASIEVDLITPVVKHFGLSDEAEMYARWGGLMVFIIVSTKLSAPTLTKAGIADWLKIAEDYLCRFASAKQTGNMAGILPNSSRTSPVIRVSDKM